MFRRIALALSASLLAAVAGAATLPSKLMLPEPERAARGYVESWVFNIELTGDELNGMEPCRKILAERGFAPTLSRTATTASPALHFKIAGHKLYAQASSEADDALLALQQARCSGALSWTVSGKMARP
nr:hypothetical protein [uncultured Duganella sp.]